MLEEKPPQRWSEVSGTLLFEFVGDPENQANRKVVAIRSLLSLAERQKGAGIPKAYRSAMLSMWDDARANPGAQDVVRSYLMSPECSLYLHGPVGVGKSWVVACIANELLSSGRTVRFQVVSGLLLELRATYTADTLSEYGVLEPLFDVEFLLLDELGDLDKQASDFSARILLTLLSERGNRGRPTMMTSNLSLGKLDKWLGQDERVASRVRGLCGERGIVELVGRDLRFDGEPANQTESVPALDGAK